MCSSSTLHAFLTILVTTALLVIGTESTVENQTESNNERYELINQNGTFTVEDNLENGTRTDLSVEVELTSPKSAEVSFTNTVSERLTTTKSSKNSGSKVKSLGSSKASRMTLPPCTDTLTDAACKSHIATNGVQLCTDDFYFGRYKCCAQCATALGAKSTDSGDPIVQLLSSPKEGCKDLQLPDSGYSFKDWCQSRCLLLASSEHSELGCSLPMCQHRCPKTCGLCK